MATPSTKGSLDTDILWHKRPCPGAYDHEEDHELQDTTTVEQFRAALYAKHGDLLRVDSCDVMARLLTLDMRPTYPLSSFVPVGTLPDRDELLQLHEIFVHQFRPQCSFINEIPSSAFPAYKSYVALAAASISSQLPQSTRDPCLDCWDLALRLVTTMPALDNRFTRTNDWALTWVLLQIAAMLSGDLERLKTLHRWHGLVISGARRTWSDSATSLQETNPNGRQWSIERQSALTLSFLLFDTLQSFCLNTLPVAYHALGSIPLAPPYGSIQGLLAQSVFGGPNSAWPCQSQPKDSLVMLTIILNEIVTWEKNMYPPDSQQSSVFSSQALDLSLASAQYRIKIQRALSRWDSLYAASASPETRALFWFCRLYLDFPSLVYLPIAANYRPCVEHHMIRTASADKMIRRDKQATPDAARHAWLLFERVCERTTLAPPWLPIITYYAALAVWDDFRTRPTGTNSRGSIQTLRLFEDELQKMAWPCCTKFSEHLKSLRQHSVSGPGGVQQPRGG